MAGAGLGLLRAVTSPQAWVVAAELRVSETGLSGAVCAGQTGQRVSPLVSWSEAGAERGTELSPGWVDSPLGGASRRLVWPGARQQGGREQVLGLVAPVAAPSSEARLSDGPTPPALGGCHFPATGF